MLANMEQINTRIHGDRAMRNGNEDANAWSESVAYASSNSMSAFSLRGFPFEFMTS